MSKDINEIKEAIRQYIIERFFKNASAADLKDSTPLISGGIIDSISTMQLVAYIEQQYHFEFAPHEVDKDNLDTIDLIAQFIQSKIA